MGLIAPSTVLPAGTRFVVLSVARPVNPSEQQLSTFDRLLSDSAPWLNVIGYVDKPLSLPPERRIATMLGRTWLLRTGQVKRAGEIVRAIGGSWVAATGNASFRAVAIDVPQFLTGLADDEAIELARRAIAGDLPGAESVPEQIEAQLRKLAKRLEEGATKWLLPLGIGLGALLLLVRK